MFRHRLLSEQLSRAPSSYGCLFNSFRGLRTQIPPRPSITVLTYLTERGSPVKSAEETDLSVVRTRDNKFWLQRVLPDETYIRFAVPGLDVLKGASNFDYFSLGDIDKHGGVYIPEELQELAIARERKMIGDEVEFLEAVKIIQMLSPTVKLTRKEKRARFRSHNTHWSETVDGRNEKNLNRLVIGALFMGFFGWKAIDYAYRGQGARMIFGGDLDNEEDQNTKASFAERMFKEAQMHPENLSQPWKEQGVVLSPGKAQLADARSELYGGAGSTSRTGAFLSDTTSPFSGSDLGLPQALPTSGGGGDSDDRAEAGSFVNNASNFGYDFVWRVNHAIQYGHIPKSRYD